MNIYSERQPRAPGAVNCLVTMLESPDHLTVTVIAPPAEMRARCTSRTDGAAVLLTDDFEDDLANATWEDAAWQ